MTHSECHYEYSSLSFQAHQRRWLAECSPAKTSIITTNNVSAANVLPMVRRALLLGNYVGHTYGSLSVGATDEY